jgi:excinuclease UvrABC nuclease subunit
MSNIYNSITTNDQILAQVHIRHKRFNLNFDLMQSIKPKSSLTSSLKWNKIKFLKGNKNILPETPGIYMFILRPYLAGLCQFSSDFILYIGQTKNLRSRYLDYFQYKNSIKAADQDKRTMIVIWENHLYFYYHSLPTNTSKTELDDLEYDLIDSVIPPFNARFRSENVKSYLKMLKP